MTRSFKIAVAASVLGLALGAVLLRMDLLSYREFLSLRITDRNGELLRTVLSGRGATSIWVPLDNMSQDLVRAQIAAEDKRFYRHPGIDPIAVGRALRQNIRQKRVVSGASTLTQQLVRVMRGYPRSLPYKGWEAAQAILLEAGTSKREILEHYLNRVPYGNQCYGIGAAAKLYFDKPASHLSLAEAAFIAGLAQSPSKYNPYRNLPSARKRQRYVLARMVETGAITAQAAEKARQEPLSLVPNRHLFRAPHFSDMVVARLPASTVSLPQEIRTTLDLKLQEDLEQLVATHVKQMSTERLSNAAVVVLDNRTREIRAMVGSADYFNEENDGQVNGALAPRPPGSTWKPFLYAMALERGHTAADVIPDVPTHAATQGGDFAPRNFDERYHGPTRIRTALACSYNIPAVRLLEDVGTDNLLRRLRALDFRFLTRHPGHYGLGLVLGGAEASLLQLTNAYAALANNGHWKPERFTWEPAFNEPNEGERVFAPPVVSVITDILSDVDARRPAFGGYSSLSLPFPCAIKTGTSKNFRDGWTLGYTTDYTIGTWVGNFDGSEMKSISGASGASMLFKQTMLRVHRDAWPGSFSLSGAVRFALVCPQSGLAPSEACPSSLREKFIAGTEPRALCPVHRLVAIDTRTGLLATPGCDPAVVRNQVYEVYDPVFKTWVIENQVPSPPSRPSPLCIEEGQPVPEQAPDVASSKKLEILFPDNGDVFLIDPVLRPEFQTLRLSANVPDNAADVEWLVNGQPFHPKTVGDPRWKLEAGEHEFKVRARIGTGWQESPRVFIKVL